MNPETKLITPTQTGEAPRGIYAPPAVIAEGELEVRAGSPVGVPNPLDPFGLEE